MCLMMGLSQDWGSKRSRALSAMVFGERGCFVLDTGQHRPRCRLDQTWIEGPPRASKYLKLLRPQSCDSPLGYLGRNEDALVHCAARRRRSEPISTAFVESAVNEFVAKRMNKKQQMRWSRATVQPLLDVRTAVLNDTLEDAFRHRHPGFRPANDHHRATTAAA